ncbi:MAG: hypothetical protein IT288_09230 [Bdellovibrionales bacterium]|nr:hypothetical protein [Bdellovibrionales bacterium]
MVTESIEIIFWLSALSLVITKIADLWTTYKMVTEKSETNPLGRWLFAKIGLLPGLFVVGALAIGIIGVTYFGAFTAGIWFQVPVAVLGYFVAIVQAAVAHHNATGHSNLMTRQVLRFHQWWSRRPFGR